MGWLLPKMQMRIMMMMRMMSEGCDRRDDHRDESCLQMMVKSNMHANRGMMLMNI
jgi:hypothetical protein